MARPTKSLAQHVIDKSFRPGRHHELLAGPALARWPELAELQVEYCMAISDAERRAVAVRFLQAIRGDPPAAEPDPAAGAFEIAAGLDVPTEEIERAKRAIREAQRRAAARGLTRAEYWLASMGPGFAGNGPDALGFRRRDGRIDWGGFDQLERRWERWDSRHGAFWRAARGMPDQMDTLKLAFLLTRKRHRRLDVAEQKLAELRDELDQLLAEREPVPDPPGLELLRLGSGKR